MATSAVLLLVTAGTWARAQWASDGAVHRQLAGPDDALRQSSVGVHAYRGSLAVFADTVQFASLEPAHAAALRRDAGPTSAWTTWHEGPQAMDPAFVSEEQDRGGAAAGGFAWQTATMRGGRYQSFVPTGSVVGYPYVDIRARRVALPWWFLTMLFALAPARALYTWRKSRRRPPHACQGCGYDLRATADPAGPRLATCPECGRTSAPASPA